MSIYCDERRRSFNEDYKDVRLDEEGGKYSYAIHIPRAYARMETNVRPDFKDLENIPNYTLYITRQVGSILNMRDTNIYYRLPSGRLVRILLHPRGGVSIDKLDHKYLIRETDELDRRIVLGFCLLNYTELKSECYDDKPFKSLHLEDAAFNYRCSKMPKRLKLGPLNNFIYISRPLKPYEESKIFSSVRFLNETA